MKKEIIEDLQVGDKLWVQYGYSIYKAKYFGKGIAITSLHKFIVSLSVSNRYWVYRETWLDKLLKFLKNKKL